MTPGRFSSGQLEDRLDKATRDATINPAAGWLALHNVAKAAIARLRVLERLLAESEPRRQSQRTKEMPGTSSGRSLPVATVASADSRRQSKHDERKVSSELYPRSGNVIPLGSKAAPGSTT